MTNKKKIYIILFSVIFLICLFGFLWSFTVTKELRKPDGKNSVKKQVVTVTNLILTETKEGKIYWELYASKGSYDSKAGDVILQNATGNFYNDNNEVVLSFESDVGTYFENTKKIVLKGHTLVVAHDGSAIRADEIAFTGQEDDIVARGNVIVNRNDDFISTADEARFNSELTFFEIKGKTETNVYTKEGLKTQELIN